jgi:hypothetical protein
MSPRRSFIYQFRALFFTGLILTAWASQVQSADVDLDVDGKPEEACLATEKTMRMIMNIWANQALDTYGQVKPDLRKGLASHGERGAKLLPVFDKIIERIESNEFLPPKVISRWEGHQKLRAATHTECMSALKQ